MLNTQTEWSSLREAVGSLSVESHPLYRGGAPQQCDVIVLEDRAYCSGFEGYFEVDFDESKAQKPDNLLKVVYRRYVRTIAAATLALALTGCAGQSAPRSSGSR